MRRRQVCERSDVGEAKAHKVGKSERPQLRNVTQRVAAHIVVLAGIRQRADADAIEHNPDDTIE